MNNSKSYDQNNFSVSPQSYWIASTKETQYPALNEDIQVDVAIVGGGMAGITTAYLLKKEGLRVAVLEADRILQGTTGYTTAKLTSQHTLIYDKIKTQMGEELARQYAEANETAIKFVAQLIEDNHIDCDFSWQPAYVFTQSDQYIEKIAKETETASKLGIKASYLEATPLPFSVKAAMRFDGQAQFHPRKYLLALAEEVHGGGSSIYEYTRVVDLQGDGPYTVITHQGKKITAPRVVTASHYPCFDIKGLYFSRIIQERSYILGSKIKEKFPGGMYINAEQPTRSLRFTPYEDGELVLIAGEHHKTGQSKDTMVHYENLRQFAQEIYTLEDIPYRWSTQDCSTLDGVPYTGHLTSGTPNLYVATGFEKWGMTNSTASAMIIRDLIVKGDSPWAPVYNPSRFTPLASAKNFIIENLDVAQEFIAGKLLPVPDHVEISVGEGKVIELEGQRVGAYRDGEGNLHLVDTTCTHLGCELQWNSAEKSWDCPCHGSRFTIDGDIIEGPTTKPLKTYKAK